MSWRGQTGGITAAQAGHDVVMAPTSHTYFDYYQGPKQAEPRAIGGYIPLKTAYEFEPIPAELSAEQAKHVLGGQGQLWGEYIAETAPEGRRQPELSLGIPRPLWGLSRQPDRCHVLAVNHLLDQIERQIVVLVGGLDASA